MKIDPQRVRIRNRVWTLLSRRLSPTLHGYCEPPTQVAKQIVISESLSGRDALETIIHEIQHAGCYDLDEQVVTTIAMDCARILWELGYRAPWDEE